MNLSNKRIAFISLSDSSSKVTWSGTPYYMSKALESKNAHVFHIGPFSGSAADKFGLLLSNVIKTVTGKKYVHRKTHFFSRGYAKIALKRLKKIQPDLIFTTASSVTAHLKECHAPLIFTSDTTFSSRYNYYPNHKNYHPECLKQANEIEKKAIDRAELVIYPSKWAADSALHDYSADSQKVHVIPYGANLETWPIVKSPPRKKAGECNLLFLGVNWERKGGQIALQTIIDLEEMYEIRANLHVCGCYPPQGVTHERMILHGFLDKRNPEQHEKLLSLFKSCHYLILPTRAECFGLVFCESSAYGLPSLTTDTGGISSVVIDGVNGYRLPLSASSKEYAHKIFSIENTENEYEHLSKTSRQFFEKKLNWTQWADRVEDLLKPL